MKIQSVLDSLAALAPVDTAESFDNVGLLVGMADREVTKVLVALDISDRVIDEAIEMGAELIVSHHPVIFSPLKTVAGDSKILRLVENRIAAICMHTCLDKANGGVGDALLARLGMRVEAVGRDGYTRVGRLQRPMSRDEFIAFVENRLNTKVRFHGTGDVRTVAVIGGSGGDFLPAIFSGDNGIPVPDAVVTGEIKHHAWLELERVPQVVVEAGHYATEHPVVDTLVTYLHRQFDPLTVVAAAESAPYQMR